MKLLYSIPSLLIVLLLIGCGRKRTIKKVPAPQYDSTYQVAVDGVECALCARNAMKQFKTIDALHDLRFTAPAGNYEKGIFSFTVEPNQKLQLLELHHVLGQIHFGVHSISGVFEGTLTPTSTGRSLDFRIPSWPYPFIIRTSDAMMEELFRTFIVERRKPIIAGTLTFEHHLKRYEFVPAQQ